MEVSQSLNIFNSNLKYLMKKHDITQKQLSEKTGMSAASINNYINKGNEPSILFILKVKELFNVGLDEMFILDLSKEIEKKPAIVKNSKLEKFFGSYIMYFYNSGEYKGKVSSYSKNTLKYAIVSFIEQPETKKVLTIASFLKSRDEAEDMKTRLDYTHSSEEKEKIHSETDQLYYGRLEASESQIFIYLKNEVLNDQSLLILNNPPSNKKYIGGLGTVNSVSRGREHMPCVQFVILSSKILKIPDGEIYNMLSLGVSDVNVETEAEQLINLFKNLYINNANLKHDLSVFQKKKIVENSLNNILVELIDANMFRFAKVSNMEDDDYYRIIKDE